MIEEKCKIIQKIEETNRNNSKIKLKIVKNLLSPYF